jgi:hypothetical protein
LVLLRILLVSTWWWLWHLTTYLPFIRVHEVL